MMRWNILLDDDVVTEKIGCTSSLDEALYAVINGCDSVDGGVMDLILSSIGRLVLASW